jgi:hypothetical protein
MMLIIVQHLIITWHTKSSSWEIESLLVKKVNGFLDYVYEI